MKYRRYTIIAIMAFVTIFFSSTADVLASETEIIEAEDTFRVYATDNTYLYEDSKGEQPLGQIPAGSTITISGETDLTFQTTFAGINGFVRKESVLKNTVPQDIQIESEVLLSASHYFDSYTVDAGMALANYTLDTDSSNDYIVICSGTSVAIPGYFINAAYENGCEELQIYYSSNKIDYDFGISFQPWDADDEDILDISFTYDNGCLAFDTTSFLTEINVGFPESVVTEIMVNGMSNTYNPEDGYCWVTLKEPAIINAVSNKTEKAATDTSSLDAVDDSEPVFVPIVIILLLIIIVIVIFKNKTRFVSAMVAVKSKVYKKRKDEDDS